MQPNFPPTNPINPDIVVPITGPEPSAPGRQVDAGKDHAAEAARQLKEAAMVKANELKGVAAVKLGEVRKRVGESALDAKAMAERQTRINPSRSLGIAFGAGFILGLIVRR